MLEDTAVRGGGGTGDGDVIGFSGERQGVSGADAVSAARGGERGNREKREGEELRDESVIAGAKGESGDGE